MFAWFAMQKEQGFSMLDKRYQVFIMSSGLDLYTERSILSQSLISHGFFPWEIEQRTSESMAVARRQIDEADYVILMLGAEYGERSTVGISYMHLEYIYAVSKQKPMLILMQSNMQKQDFIEQNVQVKDQQKLHEFIQQLREEQKQISYYSQLKDIEKIVRSNMMLMLELYPADGWVRPYALQTLKDEIEHLRLQLLQARQQLEQRKNAPQEGATIDLSKVSMNETFSIEYAMQAYQDGNFKDITAVKNIRWIELLALFAQPFETPAPEENFVKIINHFLSETALQDAVKQMPRAHAVAKVQINSQVLFQLKQQFKHQRWFEPVQSDERQRVLWKMTEKGQKLSQNYVKIKEHYPK